MNNDFTILNFTNILILVKNLICTKIFCWNARIIRFPFYIRGKKYIDLGKSLTTGVGCRLEAFPGNGNRTMYFGQNVQLNDYVHITAMNHVEIGNNVLIASKVYISDCTHGYYSGDENDSSPDEIPIKRKYNISSVIIEDNVWIGEFVSILPKVVIGKGSIIGANSVVTKNIPAYTIAVGVPAKVIKKFNFETNKWERV